ncbi:MAG: EAL domain-containing protein [Chloroflexi bacterium]|nr:MAG: EAL domain-containing protein [Chloroflexota bacterium]
MATMHPLLSRQLKKLGIADSSVSPAPESWQELLRRVSQWYTDADQERYLLERSLNISSREMQELSGSLRSERDRLSAILSSLGDGLCALDPEGRLLFINPKGEQLLGWREEELVGRVLLAMVAVSCTGSGRGDHNASLPALVGTGRTYRNEDDAFRCKDGTLLPVSYVVTPLTTQGRLSGAVLVFRDMTQRKHQLAAQTQLVRRDSLLRLARRFASESDAEQVLTDLLDEAIAVLGGDDGTLSRWDSVQCALVPVRNRVPTAAEFSSIAVGIGVNGQAIERRAPAILNDYQQQIGTETAAGRAGVRAAVAVPMLHEGRLMGALSVNTYDSARKFNDEDAEVLELLSGIGSAVLASLERTAELAAANHELRQARDEAQHQALHDSLTGLPNRTLLRDRLQQSILAAQRDNSGLALLIMDLDRFKDVNDTLGHQSGDELLEEVAERLRGALRASDTVARMGGDEFAMILPTASNAALASGIAQKLVRELERPFSVAGHPVSIGASIGIAVYVEHGTDAKTLLRHADVAMYVAKRSGSGHAVYSWEQDAHDPERLTLIGELRSAIEHDELVLHYQPKVNLRTRSCERVEALVRWQHPQRGLIPPDQFIPLAEQTGLIKQLTNWVLSAAIRQCRAWRDSGLDIAVGVNLSMRNLHDPELVGLVSQLLASHEVSPSALKVEVTESALMTDPRRALDSMARLRAIGVEVAIDDFGTGHASLSYLKQMPVEEIKLDRSFVRDMRTDRNDFTIVRSTIELAHDLGLRVIAEGVEDQATLDLLADLGCDLAQGYHMSRPLPEGDLRRWLAESAQSSLPRFTRAA